MSAKHFDPVVLAEAAKHQRGALDVGISVWVSASAGSGKTEVLTRRLMALLLTDFSLRAKEIVALTFSRAGAAEMAARLPQRLAGLAAKSDDDIAAAVKEQLGLEVEGVAARVRALAEEVLRAGPVVTTIHGLAQMLLTAFPLEAGVPSGFTVLEEGEKKQMLREIQHALLTRSDRLAEALAVLLDEHSEHGWRELTETVIFNWEDLAAVLADGGEEAAKARLREALGLTGNEGWVWAPVLPTAEEEVVLRAVAEVAPAKVAGILAARGKMREAAWREFLLTKEDGVRARLLTKAEVAAVSEAAVEILLAAQRRVCEQLKLRKVLRVQKVSEALMVWGSAVREMYQAYKRGLGMLDFDDLLVGLERLLAQAEGGKAEWVWYALDRRFRHMVVDEAQDNNARQDGIIRMLMRSMLSGEVDGARRTVMAVGDVKQSVYRFQGAVPELFLNFHDEMMAWAGGAMKAVEIRHSFRSGAHVLGAVDEVFADPELAGAVMGREGDWAVHLPVAKSRPSRVEVWPLVEKVAKPDVRPWALPQERFEAQGDGADVLCFRKVGAWLQARVDEGVVMPSTGLPLRWQDVMVVVGRNDVAALAAGVFRRMGIPAVVTSGVVPQAVLDVVALCRVVFNTRDQVALATVLKGIFGWDDARLLALAAKRDEGAWYDALEGEEKVWLEGLRGISVLDVVLAGMRRRGGRLDEFENLLAWAEQAEHMAGLVARLEREDLPASAAGAGVRIITAHGAKGLEAPLVVLPDTASAMGTVQDDVLFGAGTMVVRGKSGISDFVDRLVGEESELLRKDSLRALYVAMTRASDWLVVCGWGKASGRACWHGLVSAAAEGAAWREEAGVRVRGEAFARATGGGSVEMEVAAPEWLEAKVTRALVGGGAG